MPDFLPAVKKLDNKDALKFFSIVFYIIFVLYLVCIFSDITCKTIAV